MKFNEFNLDVEELLNIIEKNSNKKIILFGASTLGKKMLYLLEENNIEVEFFCDNNQNKWGTSLCSKKIISPKEVAQMKDECLVIITSMYFKEIYEELKASDVLNCVSVKKYSKSTYQDEFESNDEANPSSSLYKQIIVREYIKKTGAKIFVETGTYLGAMVDAVEDLVNNVYSIEIDKVLHARNLKKYDGNVKVQLFNGDSGEVLPNVIDGINEPIVFWLDGHYSGLNTSMGEKETPIIKEISSILNHKVKEHVILIDDANCFGSNAGYPKMSELEGLVKGLRENSTFNVEDNIIRICLK